MSLDDHKTALNDFGTDNNVPNIWTIDDDAQEPETKKYPEKDTDETEKDTDDELEKPSFLRRLAKRYKPEQDDQDKDSRTK